MFNVIRDCRVLAEIKRQMPTRPSFIYYPAFFLYFLLKTVGNTKNIKENTEKNKRTFSFFFFTHP